MEDPQEELQGVDPSAEVSDHGQSSSRKRAFVDTEDKQEPGTHGSPAPSSSVPNLKRQKIAANDEEHPSLTDKASEAAAAVPDEPQALSIPESVPQEKIADSTLEEQSKPGGTRVSSQSGSEADDNITSRGTSRDHSVTGSRKGETQNRHDLPKLPENPALLDPSDAGETWEERLSRFRRAIVEANAGSGHKITGQMLDTMFKRYLQAKAWHGVPNRHLKVTEAKTAIKSIRKYDKLDKIWAGDPVRPANEQSSAMEVDEETGVSTSTIQEVKSHGIMFKLPEDELLLEADHPGETWTDRFSRFATAVVEANETNKASIKQKVMSNILSSYLKHGARKGSSLKPQKIAEIKRKWRQLAKTGDIGQLMQQATGHSQEEEAPGTATPHDDSINVTDAGSDVEKDTQQQVPKESDKLDSIQARSTREDGEVDDEEGKSAPTADEWASLLNAERRSESYEPPEQVSDFPDQTRPGRSRIVMDEAEAAAQQEEYFPMATPQTICTVCASIGHTASNCPKTVCRFCDGDHFAWSCPDRRRCTKCRQLGHEKAHCPEKLAITKDEGLQCAFCDSANHVEEDCNRIWRSYNPRQEDIRTVREIPAFCSYCGSEGHFSSDCGLGGQQSFSATWSLENRDLYVDPTSNEESLSALAHTAETADNGFQVRGMAAKRTHIFFPDSEGSEEGEFIGQKVQPRGPPPQIRMATNIQFTPDAPRPPFHAQPPLPPGPPPPGPPPSRPGGYSRMAQNSRKGANQLPPRPPAPAQPGPRGSQPGFNGRTNFGNGPGPAANGPPAGNRKSSRGRGQAGGSFRPPPQEQTFGGQRKRGKGKRGGKQN